MKHLLLCVLFFYAPFSLSWDGFDYDSGVSVEIEKGNLVRNGEDIQIYDHEKGYLDVEVQEVRNLDDTVEIDVYDYEADEYRTLEMERRR